MDKDGYIICWFPCNLLLDSNSVTKQEHKAIVRNQETARQNRYCAGKVASLNKANGALKFGRF